MRVCTRTVLVDQNTRKERKKISIMQMVGALPPDNDGDDLAAAHLCSLFLSFFLTCKRKKKRACGSTRWRQYSSENVDRTKKTHLKEGDCVCDTFFLSFLQIFVILLLGFSSSSSFGLGNDRRLSGASLKRQ